MKPSFKNNTKNIHSSEQYYTKAFFFRFVYDKMFCPADSTVILKCTKTMRIVFHHFDIHHTDALVAP